MIKKILKFIKKYLPDMLMMFGIGVLSYNVLRPPTAPKMLLPKLARMSDYHTRWKVAGIILIAIGIDIAIRRYIVYKKRLNKSK